MQIIKKNFQIILVGKCSTKEDILLLLKFGYDKEKATKQYKKDNKLKIEEARRVVEQVLLEEIRNTK